MLQNIQWHSTVECVKYLMVAVLSTSTRISNMDGNDRNILFSPISHFTLDLNPSQIPGSLAIYQHEGGGMSIHRPLFILKHNSIIDTVPSRLECRVG